MKPVLSFPDPHVLPTEQGLIEWMRAVVEAAPKLSEQPKARKTQTKAAAERSKPKRIKLQKTV